MSNFYAEAYAYQEMYKNAAMGIELKTILWGYIKKTRNLTLREFTYEMGVYDKQGVLLFTSVSMAACVEFALQQPEVKEDING